jgi:mannose-6-phosphate isomerase-like protein (cupin superfamily)
MKHDRLEKMVKGWFVGAFNPTTHATEACEVAVKKYSAGEKEIEHHHKVATEVTLILSGEVRMMGRTWRDGDILTLSPGEITDFEAITDAVTVVVKTPSISGDKYFGGAALFDR